MRCKYCSNTSFYKKKTIVQDLNWEEEVEVIAAVCVACDCLHFQLEGQDVAQFSGQDQIDTFKTATYIKSDYETAIEKKSIK